MGKSSLMLALALGVTAWVAACGDGGTLDPLAPTDTNRAPVPAGTFPPQTVHVGEAVSVDVSSYFTDPDGDALSYAATSADAAVATVSVSGSTVTVNGVAQGTAVITVTATDPAGLSAQQTFQVTVPNRGPVATESIRDLEMTAGDTASVDLSSSFTDSDSDALAFSAVSSDTAVATVAVSGSTATVTAVGAGQATMTVTARDPGGLEAEQSFKVAVPNRAPVVVGPMPDLEMTAGDTESVDASPYLSDPDGDALEYEASSSDHAVATVAVSGSVVTVTAVEPGEATVTVTARDPGGLEAKQSFGVTVPTAPNRAPVAVDSPAGLTLAPGGEVTVNASAYFSDPDGDALVFTGATSNAAVATASVSENTLTVTAVRTGDATVTVTARDPGGLEAKQNWEVTVRPNRSPQVVGPIPDMRLDDVEELDVSAYFRDPDGDPLTYLVETSEGTVAFGYPRSGTTVAVAAVAQGSARLTVTASDPVGASAQQSFRVAVANQPLYGVASLADLSMVVGSTVTIDLSGYFHDPEGRQLSFGARDLFQPGVAVSISGSVLTVDAVTAKRDPGMEPRVEVTASDGGSTVKQYFDVFVAAVAPPTNARHERQGSTMVLSWEAVAEATHYNIYHSDFWARCEVNPAGRASWCDELATGVQANTYTHTDPDKDANYYWIVACGAAGCSYPRWVGPPLEGSVSVTGRDHNSLTVRLRSSYADYVELYRSTAVNGPYSRAGGDIDTGGQNVIVHADDGLGSDAAYYYKMRGCTAAGCTDDSAPVAGTTEAAGSVAIPQAVTGLRGEKVDVFFGTDEARIAWDAVPGATHYRVYQDGEREAEVSAPGTGYYDADPNSLAAAFATTTYQVLACNKAGCSSSAAGVVVK